MVHQHTLVELGYAYHSTSQRRKAPRVVVEWIIPVAGAGITAIATAVAKVRVARYRHQSLLALTAKARPQDIPAVARAALQPRQLGPFRQPGTPPADDQPMGGDTPAAQSSDQPVDDTQP